jgi:hypothetical protein
MTGPAYSGGVMKNMMCTDNHYMADHFAFDILANTRHYYGIRTFLWNSDKPPRVYGNAKER